MTTSQSPERIALPFPLSVRLPLVAGSRAVLSLTIPAGRTPLGGRLFVSRSPLPAIACEHCTQPIDPVLPMIRLVEVSLRLFSDVRSRDLLPEMPRVDDTSWPGVPIGILAHFGIALPEVPFSPGSILTAVLEVAADPKLAVSWGRPGQTFGDEGARADEQAWCINMAALAARLTGLEIQAVLASKAS